MRWKMRWLGWCRAAGIRQCPRTKTQDTTRHVSPVHSRTHAIFKQHLFYSSRTAQNSGVTLYQGIINVIIKRRVTPAPVYSTARFHPFFSRCKWLIFGITATSAYIRTAKAQCKKLRSRSSCLYKCVSVSVIVNPHPSRPKFVAFGPA
jgi:hypothetical protein